MTSVTVDKLLCKPLMHDHVVGDIIGLSGALIFKGNIDIPGDFPTSAEVENGWTYTITSDVTDNDATKTNTGDSFLKGDEIAWNGTDWTVLGNELIWTKSGTTISQFVAGDDLELGTGDLAATDGDFSGDLTAGGDIICNNIYAANLSGNTDGGFANSVYLAIQLIDGGGA